MTNLSEAVHNALALLAANGGRIEFVADLGGFAFALGDHPGHVSRRTVDALVGRQLARLRNSADGGYLVLTAAGADALRETP